VINNDYPAGTASLATRRHPLCDAGAIVSRVLAPLSVAPRGTLLTARRARGDLVAAPLARIRRG